MDSSYHRNILEGWISLAYKSKYEIQVAKTLRKFGISFKYEPEVVEFLQPEKRRKYTPDFKIEVKGEGPIYIETKGKLTAQDRFKMQWVKEQNPAKKFVLLFMNADVKLRKGSKTTYGDWATKAGFEWYDFRRGLPTKWKESA